MPRAAGCSPAARRPNRTTERDGKWLQDRILRRLLLPGRRAVRRVRSTRRAGWNGLRGLSPAFAAPVAAAAARCPLRWQKAAVCFWRRHASHLKAERPGGRPPSINPTQANQRNSCANAFGSQSCDFASLRRIASAKETHNRTVKRLFFLFGSALGGNNGC